MAELKKCPFCGGEAKYIEGRDFFISKFVTCTKCGIETRRNYVRKNEAIEAWNNRATESEIRAMAIDEFAEKLGEEFSEKAGTIKVDGIQYDILTLDSVIEIMWDLVEQLKEE